MRSSSAAKEAEADLILATDPDCDRMGCAAPRTKDRAGEWGTFTGNQLVRSADRLSSASSARRPAR